jgi:DNA-binding transcriptional LysR family regulator
MELHQLRGFHEIARQGSFTKAADKLYLTQPAISLQLKSLEEELGEVLLERAHKRIRLTPAGEILLRRTKTVLAELDSAHAEIASLRQELRGHLVLGTSDTNSTYVLPEILRAYREGFPQVEVDIRNKMSTEVGRLVVDDEVDLGLATLPVRDRERLEQAQSLFTRQDVLICPPGHALAGRQQIALKTVVNYPLLALEPGSTTRHLLEQSFRAADLKPRVSMNLGSIEVIKRFVEIGFGVAIVPKIAIEQEVAAGRLHAMTVRGLKPRPIGLVEHRGRRRSPAAEAFVQMLTSSLGGRAL